MGRSSECTWRDACGGEEGMAKEGTVAVRMPRLFSWLMGLLVWLVGGQASRLRCWALLDLGLCGCHVGAKTCSFGRSGALWVPCGRKNLLLWKIGACAPVGRSGCWQKGGLACLWLSMH